MPPGPLKFTAKARERPCCGPLVPSRVLLCSPVSGAEAGHDQDRVQKHDGA